MSDFLAQIDPGAGDQSLTALVDALLDSASAGDWVGVGVVALAAVIVVVRVVLKRRSR